MTLSRPAIALVAAVLLPLSVASRAQNASSTPSSPAGPAWPGLWGPSRDGVAPAVHAPRGFKLLWRRATSGGYAEILAAGDRLYTLELRDGIDSVVALDARTGAERWRTAIGPTYRGHEGSHDGPISTPSLDGADIYALGPNGHLLALDSGSGKERWRHDVVKEYDATSPAYGFSSSPLIEGDRLYVQTGGDKSRGLLAFDRVTGRLVWSAAPGVRAGYSSPIAATLAGTRQIVTAAGDQIFGTSTDGRVLWSIKGPGSGESVANLPIVLPDDRVLLTFWNDAVLVKVAREGDAFTATELWRSPRLRSSYGPTIFRDGFLYGFNGPMLTCLDASTGDVRWRHRTYEGTVVGIGQHLLVLSRASGNLHVVSASPTAYTELLQAPVLTPGATSMTGPTAAGNRLYLRNVEEIAAFEIESSR